MAIVVYCLGTAKQQHVLPRLTRSCYSVLLLRELSLILHIITTISTLSALRLSIIVQLVAGLTHSHSESVSNYVTGFLPGPTFPSPGQAVWWGQFRKTGGSVP